MSKAKDSEDRQATPRTGRFWRGWAVAAGAAMTLSAAALGVAPVDSHAQQPPAEAQPGSDFHEVRSGDTFWHLSGRYLGNNYDWPRMWSYNPHITNPHWIYPGDIVYLRDMPEAGEVSDEVAEANGDTAGAQQARSVHEDTVGLYLATAGMIKSEQPTPVGRIIGAPKPARMIAEHDDIFVGFGDRAYRQDERDDINDEDLLEVEDVSAEEGDRFAIIRLDGEIEDSEGEVVGLKYLLLGSATVTEVPANEETARTAQVDNSWREIKRGDLLIPYQRQLNLVEPRQADQDLVGEIVDSIAPGAIFGPQQYVFVNRGSEDGVRPGNRFFAYQQWEGFEHPHEQSAPEIPWQRVGQVWVLHVEDNYSTAVITNSDRELYIGDRLEMYSGH